MGTGTNGFGWKSQLGIKGKLASRHPIAAIVVESQDDFSRKIPEESQFVKPIRRKQSTCETGWHMNRLNFLSVGRIGGLWRTHVQELFSGRSSLILLPPHITP
jgi:hypothetical protein